MPRIVFLFALVAASLVVAGSATAASAPCWKRVLADRSDGGLDRTYSAGCYRAALHHLPGDLAAYSTAADDLQRGLLAALAAPAASVKSEPAPTRKTAVAAPVTRAPDAPLARLASGLESADATRSPRALVWLLALILVLATAASVAIRQQRGGSPARPVWLVRRLLRSHR